MALKLTWSKEVTMVAIAFLVLISGTSIIPYYGSGSSRDPGTVELLSSRPAPTRGGELPATSILLEAGVGDWVSSMEDLKLSKDSYFEVDDLKYREIDRFDGHSLSTRSMLSSRSMAWSDGLYLVGYIKQNSTLPGRPFEFILAGSYDGGTTWEHFEVMTTVNLLSASVELLVHEEKLFYAVIDKAGTTANDIYVKVTPLLNWKNITSVDPQAFIVPNGAAQTKFIGVRDRVLLFSKPQGYRHPSYFIYSNGTWSGRIEMTFSTICIAPVSLERDDLEQISVLFLQGTSADEIREQTSTDGGNTWRNPTLIATSDFEIENIASSSSNGDVRSAITYKTRSQVGFISYDGSVTASIRDIAIKGSNGLDGDDNEITIASRGDDIMIVFEGDNGMITVGRSFDSGASFRFQDHGDGLVHSPSIEEDLRSLAYINGTSIQIGGFTGALTGKLETEIISVPALSSWDQIGFSMGGADRDGSFEFRVISSSGLDQLFPVTGYLSVHSQPGAYMGGHYFQHVVDMSAMDNDPPHREVYLELKFSTTMGEAPTLFSVLLNFTTEYPYTMDITDEINIISSQDMKVSPIGLELISTSNSGSAVIGPFRVEDLPPHHLWARGTFLNTKDLCTFSVLTNNMTTIEGFGSEDSDELTLAGTYIPIKWGIRNVFDIPVSVKEFYIGIHMVRVGSFSPRLTSIKLGYSIPPIINGAELDQNILFRERDTLLHIDADDQEDPPSHLSLYVEAMRPGSSTWTTEGLSDAIWSGTDWEVRIVADSISELGHYSFRIIVFDSIGIAGEPLLLSDALEVWNNRPAPPMVKVGPEFPRTGETISIELVRPGEDVETPIDLLTYNVHIIKDGQVLIYDDNLTTATASYSEPVLKKGDRWEVLVTTWDGIEESAPFISKLNVGNTDPEVTLKDLDLEVYEDESEVEYDPSQWFADIDDDDLVFTVKGPEEISPQIIDGMIRLDLEADHHGTEWLWVNAFDGSENSSLNLTLDVIGVNDDPKWNVIPDLSVPEGKWIYVDIGAVDERDGDTVSVTVDGFVDGIERGRNYHSYPNGSFMFQPDNSMVGTHLVEFKVSDGSVELRDGFNLTVENVDQPPEAPNVVLKPDSHVLFLGDDVVLEANATDPDTIWGDVIVYKWRSSIDGDIGFGASIRPTLSIGVHTIVVIATDSEGMMNTTSFKLEVLPLEKGGGSTMRTWFVLTISAAIPLIFSIIIGIIIALLMLSRKKKDSEDKDQEKENESPRPPETSLSSPSGPMKDQARSNSNELRPGAFPTRQLPPVDVPATEPQTETPTSPPPEIDTQPEEKEGMDGIGGNIGSSTEVRI